MEWEGAIRWREGGRQDRWNEKSFSTFWNLFEFWISRFFFSSAERIIENISVFFGNRFGFLRTSGVRRWSKDVIWKKNKLFTNYAEQADKNEKKLMKTRKVPQKLKKFVIRDKAMVALMNRWNSLILPKIPRWRQERTMKLKNPRKSKTSSAQSWFKSTS